MPIYEYQCTKCGRIAEAIWPISKAPQSVRSECCKKPAHKIISGPVKIVIKGPGMDKYRGKNFAMPVNEHLERMRGW